MNQASDMFVFQSLAFFLKKVAIFRKNLKVDNFFNIIKNKTRQKKNSNIVKKYGLSASNVLLKITCTLCFVYYKKLYTALLEYS